MTIALVHPPASAHRHGRPPVARTDAVDAKTDAGIDADGAGGDHDRAEPDRDIAVGDIAKIDLSNDVAGDTPIDAEAFATIDEAIASDTGDARAVTEISRAASISPPVAASAKTALPDGPALIVLGRDDAGKTHASWFTADEAALAGKAAELMGMQALEIAGEVLVRAAASLPHGRVFASGKAFVPFVKAAVFDTLATHLPPAFRAELNGPRRKVETAGKAQAVETARSTAKAGKSAAKGNAKAVGAKAVLDRSAVGKVGAASGTTATGSDQASANTGKGAPAPASPTVPADWSAIVVGSLVLASEGPDDGWYESVVLEAHEDELFTLGWRDWPELPTFVRRRRHLGLLHPDHATE